ncbi:hypothetical protein BH09BAC6_BH09BAC6_13470 [soil metagenome]|jgi:hypothetical protein
MKTTLAILLSFFLYLNCRAQDKAGVENAVRNYVDGFYYGDTAKIMNSISPEVIKHGYEYLKDKKVFAKDTMTYRQCMDYAAHIHKRGVNAKVESFPKKIEVFDVLDKTACAKLTAWWGTDYLLLTKTDGKWLITHVLWQSPPVVAVN